MTIRRGEIYWVEFDPVKGSEQGGLRPALVVQHDIGNENGPTTVVVAVTGRLPLRSYPFVVVVEPADSGLRARSTVNCSQMATIQQQGPDSRLRPHPGQHEVAPIGRLSLPKMLEVDAAIRYNLGLG